MCRPTRSIEIDTVDRRKELLQFVFTQSPVRTNSTAQIESVGLYGCDGFTHISTIEGPGEENRHI